MTLSYLIVKWKKSIFLLVVEIAVCQFVILCWGYKIC